MRLPIEGAPRVTGTMTAFSPPIRSHVAFLSIMLLFTSCWGVSKSQGNVALAGAGNIPTASPVTNATTPTIVSTISGDGAAIVTSSIVTNTRNNTLQAPIQAGATQTTEGTSSPIQPSAIATQTIQPATFSTGSLASPTLTTHAQRTVVSNATFQLPSQAIVSGTSASTLPMQGKVSTASSPTREPQGTVISSSRTKAPTPTQKSQATVTDSKQFSSTETLTWSTEKDAISSSTPVMPITLSSPQSPVPQATTITGATTISAIVVVSESTRAEMSSSTMPLTSVMSTLSTSSTPASPAVSPSVSSTVSPVGHLSSTSSITSSRSGTTQGLIIIPSGASSTMHTRTEVHIRGTTSGRGGTGPIRFSTVPVTKTPPVKSTTTDSYSKPVRTTWMVKPSITTARTLGITTRRPMHQTTHYASGAPVLSEAPIRTSKHAQLPAQTTKYRSTGAQATTMPPARVNATTGLPVQPRSPMATTGRVRATTLPPIVHSPKQTLKVHTTRRHTTMGVVTTPYMVRTTKKIVTVRPSLVQSTEKLRTSTLAKRTTTRPAPATRPSLPFIPRTIPPEVPKDVTYSFRFEGDCSIVLTDTDVRGKFEKSLKEMFTKKLGVQQDNILFHDISCGSVDVLVTLHDIQQLKVEAQLNKIIANPIPLSVKSRGQTHAFLPMSYILADPSSKSRPTPPDMGQTIRPTTESNRLRSVDMIIIIVVSIVGGMLIIIIITLIIHECRRRSHTKSFDLRGTPRAHINTEDFTLTKMERGPAEYNDYGLVINSTSNGHSRTPLVGIATIVETPTHQNGDAMFNGYHNTGKESYEPEFDGVPDSPSMSLMKSMRTPHSVGIENPSFSSEDILDSGTETDRDNVCSEKGIDSPDHVALSKEHIAECDSGRQSDSPMELCTTDTPPQLSPHSTLSDNTGSDNAYEAYEPPLVMDSPRSLSEEVLMPSEELSYPSEDIIAVTTERLSPHEPPNTLNYSPEANEYEMVETKRAGPGARESDFFAPTEGATAF